MKLSHAIIWLILTGILLVQCQKDPLLTEEQISPKTLPDFLSFENLADQKQIEFAFASDYKSTEDDFIQQQIEFHFSADIEEIMLFVTDTLRWKDSLALYHKYPIESVSPATKYFYETRFNGPSGNYYARILARSGNTHFLSEAISIRSGTLVVDTIDSEEISVRLAENGFTNFRWPAVAATEFYLLRLIDNQGAAISQFTMRRPEFNFYDLREVEKNLGPILRDPALITNENYTIKIDAINQSNWLMASGILNFKAP